MKKYIFILSAFNIYIGSLYKIVSYKAETKIKIYYRTTILCESKMQVYYILIGFKSNANVNIKYQVSYACLCFIRTSIISVHLCVNSTRHINCDTSINSRVTACLNECTAKNCYKSNDVENYLEYLKCQTSLGEIMSK